MAVLRRRLALSLVVASVVVGLHVTTSSAWAETIIGRASVVDGDTIEIQGKRIRLWGIDAPESDQTCQRDGKPYRCGQVAALALAEQLTDAPVMCVPKTKDQYGRIVAWCRLGGIDLQAWMVVEGHAMAFRRYSTDYVEHETWAKANRVGIWAGTFQPPWEYRAKKR